MKFAIWFFIGFLPMLAYTAGMLIISLRARYKRPLYTFQILMPVVAVSLSPLYYLTKNQVVAVIMFLFTILPVLIYTVWLSHPMSFVVYTAKNDRRVSIRYYSQKDKRWSEKGYGLSKTIGKAGCCPTCIAMLTTLTDKPKTPAEIADWIDQNSHGRITNDGTVMEAFLDYGIAHGWQCETIRKEEFEKVGQYLQKGFWVVAALPYDYNKPKNPSDLFHFVLIYNYNKKYLILDPDAVNGVVTMSEGQFESICKTRKLFTYPFIAIKVPQKEK